MKVKKSKSLDVATFFKEEILSTRIAVDRIRQRPSSQEISYSSLRMMKKFTDNKKKKLTNLST